MPPSDLAQRLWAARRTGSTIDAGGVALPRTAEQAYAIQWEIVRLSGYTVVGFKIGSTSIEAQRLLGTDEPGSAALLAPFVLESPAAFAVRAAHMPCIEGEIAFRMGQSLPPRQEPYGREEVAGAVAAVGGAIEVVGTRFTGGLAGKGRLLTTADGGVNIALVTGAWTADWRSLDLPAETVRMTINGVSKGSGTGARALGDPMNVLVWLANQQSRLGRGLAAGAIVSTGTCTGLDAVCAGDHVVADFGSLGPVEIHLR
ncbi:MAG: fumarylacetoacetate hydrolase family protein [Hyphomicrobiaceae bacterium]|nr:fumarylacetoacetate hydrolase family protein [Hyphomicrobiaceae bacterium]